MPAVDLRIHSVYLLASLDPLCAGMYYVGYTTDPLRRLKQHNGELLNGAHRTSRKGRPWCLVAVVSGFGEDRCALRFEWSWQYPAQAVAVKDAAMELRKARVNQRNLPYAVAVLHRLLRIEPFASIKLSLFVLRPDLFFPLSVAVGTIVPPPAMITAALAADNTVAGPAMAGKIQALLAACATRTAAAAAATAGAVDNPAAAPVSFHTLHTGDSATARLVALLATADTSLINSPLLKSSQNASQDSNNKKDHDPNGFGQRAGSQPRQQQQQLELSDVDSSDTDTAEETRRLEEVGAIGCTLCGKSAPSILLLMRCPGNFVEQRNRRKNNNEERAKNDEDGHEQQQQQHQQSDDGDGNDDGELLRNMPSCIMQCHVSCLAVWFQSCHEEGRAEQKRTVREKQDAALREAARQRREREAQDLDNFGLDSLMARTEDCDNRRQPRLPPPPLELPDPISMPPASGFSAPCPICACALHWPLLVAALKERLRRFQQRLEVKKRLAIEMRRVGLKVQARGEASSRERKKKTTKNNNGAKNQKNDDDEDCYGGGGGGGMLFNNNFSSPPGLPLATRRQRAAVADSSRNNNFNLHHDDEDPFGPSVPSNSASVRVHDNNNNNNRNNSSSIINNPNAGPIFSFSQSETSQQQPHQQKSQALRKGVTRFNPAIHTAKTDAKKSAAQQLFESFSTSSALPKDLF